MYLLTKTQVLVKTKVFMFFFQLDRLSGLGYLPILILGKEVGVTVVADIKYSLDFQLPPSLEKSLKDAVETILRSKYYSATILFIYLLLV